MNVRIVRGWVRHSGGVRLWVLRQSLVVMLMLVLRRLSRGDGVQALLGLVWLGLRRSVSEVFYVLCKTQ